MTRAIKASKIPFYIAKFMDTIAPFWRRIEIVALALGMVSLKFMDTIAPFWRRIEIVALALGMVSLVIVILLAASYDTDKLVDQSNLPITRLEVDGTSYYVGGNLAVTSSSSLKLSTKEASGFEKTYYRYYPSELQYNKSAATPAFEQGQDFRLLEPDGTYVLEFYSIDRLHNAEAVNKRTIIVDNTPPVTSKIKPDFVSGTNKLELIAHEAGGVGIGRSQYSGIYYKLDLSSSYAFVNANSTTISMANMTSGAHTVEYYSSDNMDNSEQPKTVRFFFYNNCQDVPLANLRGVNFLDPVLTNKDSTSFFTSYPAYVFDMFERMRENGYNVIRVPYGWESYEAHPSEFMTRAEEIASTAEQFGICVIFDFHHWGTSSYFSDWRMGFPDFVLDRYAQDGGEEQVRNFWEDFYANKLTINGSKAWDLQIAFMNDIIGHVDNYDSVLGYEILNEPQVHDYSQYEKLGHYHTYVAQQLRMHTQKLLFFDADHPEGVSRDHTLDRLIAPTGVSKIVFSPHVYSALSAGSGAEWQMKKWKENAQAWGDVPIFVGEWAGNNQTSMDINAKYFENSGQGWCYWAYAPYTLYQRYYQLIDLENKTTVYWDWLVQASN